MYVFSSTYANQWESTKIYIDGVLYNGGAQALAATGAVSSLNSLILGGTSAYGRSTQFYIRDVRISNVRRDDTYAFNSAKALLSL
jgi:hypothetical protein